MEYNGISVSTTVSYVCRTSVIIALMASRACSLSFAPIAAPASSFTDVTNSARSSLNFAIPTSRLISLGMQVACPVLASPKIGLRDSGAMFSFTINHIAHQRSKGDDRSSMGRHQTGMVHIDGLLDWRLHRPRIGPLVNRVPEVGQQFVYVDLECWKAVMLAGDEEFEPATDLSGKGYEDLCVDRRVEEIKDRFRDPQTRVRRAAVSADRSGWPRYLRSPATGRRDPAPSRRWPRRLLLRASVPQCVAVAHWP